MKDRQELILSLNNIEDIKKLEENKNIKYINIDITNPNKEIIDYLIKNGENLLYAEIINHQKGYIYIDYNSFKKGQIILEEIIKTIPKNLTKLEISKYLYITLGRLIGYDINSIPEKNEILNLSTINTISNLWGSLSNGKGNNVSFTKIYYYLCRLVDIDCKIITINTYGYQKNIISIDNTEIITDITNDIPYIQSGFQTRYFGTYNDDEYLDKRIGYKKNNYSEKEIENIIRELDFKSENFFKQLLLKTQNIIKVDNIGQVELGIIYNEIFLKYCPNQKIRINNLYINNDNKKEHFILITNEGIHYSYNYVKNSFVEIRDEELEKNIKNNKIGIYRGEFIPLNTKVNRQKIA